MGSSESTWLRAREANSRQYSWADFAPKSCGEAYLQKDQRQHCLFPCLSSPPNGWMREIKMENKKQKTKNKKQKIKNI